MKVRVFALLIFHLCLGLYVSWDKLSIPLYYDEVWAYFSPSYFVADNGFFESYFNKQHFELELFGRAPLYPLFTSWVIKLSDLSVYWLRIYQTCLYITVLLIPSFFLLKLRSLKHAIFFCIIFGLGSAPFHMATTVTSDFLTALITLLFILTLNRNSYAALFFAAMLVLTRTFSGMVFFSYFLYLFLAREETLVDWLRSKKVKILLISGGLSGLYYGFLYFVYGRITTGFATNGDINLSLNSYSSNLSDFCYFLLIKNPILLVLILGSCLSSKKSSYLAGSLILFPIMVISFVDYSFPRYLLPFLALYCYLLIKDRYLSLSKIHLVAALVIQISIHHLWLSSSNKEKFHTVAPRFHDMFYQLEKINFKNGLLISSYVEKYFRTYGFEDLLKKQGIRDTSFFSKHQVLNYTQIDNYELLGDFEYILANLWTQKKLNELYPETYIEVNAFTFYDKPYTKLLKRTKELK